MGPRSLDRDGIRDAGVLDASSSQRSSLSFDRIRAADKITSSAGPTIRNASSPSASPAARSTPTNTSNGATSSDRADDANPNAHRARRTRRRVAGRSVDLAIGAARRGFDTGNGGYRNSSQTTCTVPNLPGTVVNVSVTNMGGPMMGGAGHGRRRARGNDAPHRRRHLRAVTARCRSSRRISDRSTTSSSSSPSPTTKSSAPARSATTAQSTRPQASAKRPTPADPAPATASHPAASSWTTVTLAPGRYELVCNLPGHYAAGMYTQLTVR